MLSKTILLVEDRPDDIELTIRALKQSHLTNDIVVATDGAKALDYLFGRGEYEGRDTSHVPALMLLDLKLPKIEGLEVLRQARESPLLKMLPVVILTSSREDQDLAKGYGLGANSYIRKPVDFVQFAEAIRQLGLYWLVLNERAPAGAIR